MKFILSSRACRDLHEIGDWIARDDPDAAARLLLELEIKARAITTMPLACPVASRLGDRGIRKQSVGDYLIFYCADRGAVRIARIMHARRDHAALSGQ